MAGASSIVSARSQSVIRVVQEIDDPLSGTAPDRAVLPQSVSVEVYHRIEDVEAIWRRLTHGGIESPGQSFDFIRLWVTDRRIPGKDQYYVLGRVDGEPVAILPLHRRRVHGIRVYTWFPGAHAGCYTPVADLGWLAALGPSGRASFWRAMVGSLDRADAVYLRSVPAAAGGVEGIFDELGSNLVVETLYRSVYSSWEACDGQQRSRSRRKHDRQQGERLAALGEVGFSEVTDLAEAHMAVDIMFAQRSARFRAQGIRDTFVADGLTGFYHAALEPGSGVDVRLYVLRLDGKIVAARYNVVHGDRMFCLISSMSDCARIQTGSPGKQCLLRVMQTVFDQGYSVFDMGCGYTDEKRHWCNVQVPLRQHYIALSPQGAAVVGLHKAYQRFRAWAKGNAAIRGTLRSLGQLRDRLLSPRSSEQL